MSPSHSPSSFSRVSPVFGQRHDLLDLDWKAAALDFSFKTAPIGAFWAFSHGFWFATPNKAILQNIFVKGASFGAFGAAYQGTAVLSAHLRGRNDSINQAFGGFVAGGLAGLARSSVRHAAAYGAILAYTSYFITEAGADHYNRLSHQPGENLLPGFLKVPNDPFASRIQEKN